MPTELASSLSRLEGVLVRSKATIASVLSPGAAEDRIRATLRGIGLDPTEEIVDWFGWHDGAGAEGMPSSVIELAPGGEFYRLEYFVGKYIETRDSVLELAARPGFPFAAEEMWSTSWFPFLRLLGKGFLAAEVGVPGQVASPVHVVWHDEEPEAAARVAWPTMAVFVDHVIDRFEDGTYSVDRDGIVRGPTIDSPSE